MNNISVLELSKKYINDFYDGDAVKAARAADGIIFDAERIKKSFNAGRGSAADFIRYATRNIKYCYYYDIRTAQFLTPAQLRGLLKEVI